MADVARALMITLDACARHGKRCPTLGDLGAVLGTNTTKVHQAFHVLRKDGKITWKTPYCGTGLGKVRVVMVIGLGKATAQPAYQARATGSIKAAKGERHEIDRAKTALRRFGHTVFNAEVTDGPGAEGLIKVDNKNMKPADVLAMARETGAL